MKRNAGPYLFYIVISSPLFTYLISHLCRHNFCSVYFLELLDSDLNSPWSLTIVNRVMINMKNAYKVPMIKYYTMICPNFENDNTRASLESC